jgi:uncharacterized protein (TIGR02270 family)
VLSTNKSRAAAVIIPEIIREHFESYAFLWRQWLAARRSPDFVAAELAPFEERMEAHLDGLLVAGERALPLVEAGLTDEAAAAALAAGYALLAMDRDDAAAKVADALALAKGPVLEGLRDALCLGNPARLLPRLRELLASPSALAAVTAAEVLAFHGHLDPSSGRLASFFTDGDPAVRRAAWRIVALLDSSNPRGR